MAVALRLDLDRMLTVNSNLLNPRIGCGLMFRKIPPYQGNDVLKDIMSNYGYPRVAADRAGAKLLDDNENLMRAFCNNADIEKLSLKENFKVVYGAHAILLAVDNAKKTSFFLAEPGNRLTLANYYRDMMPQLVKALGMALGGSVSRLTLAGWQNLHDVLSDINFKADYPTVRRIEIMTTVPAIRWREPVLEFGINLLNFSDPRTIRRTLSREIRGVIEV